jgi:hypothetical protein
VIVFAKVRADRADRCCGLAGGAGDDGRPTLGKFDRHPPNQRGCRRAWPAGRSPARPRTRRACLCCPTCPSRARPAQPQRCRSRRGPTRSDDRFEARHGPPRPADRDILRSTTCRRRCWFTPHSMNRHWSPSEGSGRRASSGGHCPERLRTRLHRLITRRGRACHRRLARYDAEGDAAFQPRSRAPNTSPHRSAAAVEDQIVALRERLLKQRRRTHDRLALQHAGAPVPSVATIWRILSGRGQVSPEPQKRPRSSCTRFTADLPNECWQADPTHWRLADDSTEGADAGN